MVSGCHCDSLQVSFVCSQHAQQLSNNSVNLRILVNSPLFVTTIQLLIICLHVMHTRAFSQMLVNLILAVTVWLGDKLVVYFLWSIV